MKKLLSVLLVLAMLLALAACGGSPASSIPEPESPSALQPEASKPQPEVTVPEDPPLPYVNPLTGEGLASDISAYRPYAIMLNNIKQALPQSGNAQADLYYELPEEGGITRIMAVYQDLTGVGKLGSIRSTRPYYVQLAYSLDSILIHAGGSAAAYTALDQLAMEDIDSLGKGSSVFYRDQARLDAGKSLEHTLYADSDTIQDWVSSSSGYRTEQESVSTFHTFVEDGTPADGLAANTVTVPFSGYKTGVFRYDAEHGVYQVEEFDAPYIDEQTGEQITVTNVLVIQTSISTIKGDSKGRLNIELLGSGSGYYACGGKYIPIVWSKADYSDPYTLTTAQGEEISLGVGKTYINIVSTKQDITFE